MPSMDIIQPVKAERPKSSLARKGIRELIVDHLKSRIATEEDASRYMLGLGRKAPKVEVFDVLSKLRSEEAEQF